VFDPFEDFAEKGYLRNKQGERDLRVVKEVEHALFVVHLPEAQQFLSTRRRIQYAEALRVHEILFSELYPWAGQDRRKVAPNIAVRKGEVMFAHPAAAQRAVEWALESGRNQAHMRAHPGEVMGHLAFGHPFLDGNGRTLLLVHSELCRRAGFSIDWPRTKKADYLAALTKEIESPGKDILDAYLKPFVGAVLDGEALAERMLAIKGLDGIQDEDQESASLADPAVMENYRKFESSRGYSYEEVRKGPDRDTKP
jgi:cell filamentation protein, protein adenylyltransferase